MHPRFNRASYFGDVRNAPTETNGPRVRRQLRLDSPGSSEAWVRRPVGRRNDCPNLAALTFGIMDLAPAGWH
jgi:hypothetical protein